MAEQAQGIPTRPTPPAVACLRCREQKLKCGREQPACERCRKQAATCTYPAPPDRKRIAAEKNNRTKASQSKSVQHMHGREPSPAESNAVKKQRLSHDDTTGPFHCLAEPDTADLPSTEIGLLLAEVYFKRVYNAHLMFHKTVCFQVYMLNKTPDYLLRAYFAHAALFLQEIEPQHQKYVKVFPMQTLHERSWPWAHAASVQILSHVDEPSVLKIQALQVLQQYYWARGEIVRAKVHATLAHRLSQLLGYDKLYEDEDIGLKSPSLKFDREIRRRAFWASWATICLHSEELPRIHESAAGLPLPAKFGPGGSIQGVELTHGQKMNRAWKLHDDSTPPGGETSSLMAELMKLLGIWSKIRESVLELRTRPTLQAMQAFQQADESLRQVEQSMHFPVKDFFAKANYYDESPEFLVCVCSIHYLSRIFAEACKNQIVPDSISPIFGGTPGLPHSPEGTVVLDQSLKFTELLQQLLANGLDVTKLWHVTGYAAFIVARVFLLYYQPNGFVTGSPQAPGLDSDEMKTCQTVLEILSIYWKPLKSLVANLHVTIDIARTNHADSNAMLAFPWDYINFVSDGEPVLNAGTSV